MYHETKPLVILSHFIILVDCEKIHAYKQHQFAGVKYVVYVHSNTPTKLQYYKDLNLDT